MAPIQDPDVDRVWKIDKSSGGVLREVGHRPNVCVIAGDTLLAAAEALADHRDAGSLKIRSGEHLAGIVLSAFGGSIDLIDSHGSFDFELSDDEDRIFDGALSAVVEVKSAKGDWREHYSRGKVGDSHEVPVEDHVEVLRNQSSLISKAVDQINSKAGSDSDASREVFIVIHPFDRATPAALSSDPRTALYADLPRPNPALEIDGLWSILYPGLIARWSKHSQCWTKFLIASKEMGDESDHDLVSAESKFLESMAVKRKAKIDFAWFDGLV